MAQFARPDSDVTNTGTNGFGAIDESVASDADFWYGDNNTAEELEVGLGDVTDPTSSTGHTFRYRIAKTNAGTVDGGGNAVTVTARLMQGTTQIATDTAKTADGTWTQYAYTLSGAEADAITDYTDLRLEFVTSASGGSPANRRGGAVSWAELEVPNASSNTTVTPGTASLVLTAFAAVVTVTANVLVTPGTAALTLTALAPTVTASDHKTVTPGIGTLSLTAFAPSVALGIRVEPGTASLALTAFAPTVSAPRLVTPGAASLTLTAFAPTVSAPRLVTPGVATLALTAFAPTVTAGAGGGGVTVTPGVASLTLAAFAPTVTAPRLVTPGLASLTLTAFAATVTASDHKTVTPGVAALVLTALAPTVSTGSIVVGGIPPGAYASTSRPTGTSVHLIPGGRASPN